ncbi:MAG: transposase [Salinivirgaceae bacterium]|nr:transposase [Salinivirgaceae bacterium]
MVVESYRRKLPHIHPPDAVLFITFRLKDTIPKSLLLELSKVVNKESLENNVTKHRIELEKKELNDSIEEILDTAQYGESFLKQPGIAKIVMDALHYLDGKDFKLIRYCVMSNHVHLIAYKFQRPVHNIMKSLKTFTAHQINEKLNRKGRLWQREYYDRVVRDRNDLSTKIDYVLNNPVKIHLVHHWKEYPFSWVREGFK